MKYCRFVYEGTPQFGLIETVAGADEITRVLPTLPDTDFPERRAKKIVPVPFAGAALLPVVEPTKIVCIGRNYREHARELGNEAPPEPLIFLKPPSSLLAPGGTIVRPGLSSRVDHEGELGVVIGKRCRNLREDEDVRPYLLGYTSVNDVTARDLQRKDGQWTRGKGFDTFCPAGPVAVDNLDPWAGIEVEVRVNGNLKQRGNTRDLIFPLDCLIRFIAQVMTLVPGDLIATGTPSGVGPLERGDRVEVRVEGVGSLQNPVL